MTTLTNDVQSLSSANTSINKDKLPRLFHYINWNMFKGKTIVDIGCGRYTDHIKDFLTQFDITYKGYDPNWKTKEENEDALNSLPALVVCSNTMNVIKEDKILLALHHLVRHCGDNYVISIYSGNKSKIGCQSQEDCWQRNEPLSSYCISCRDNIKYNLITNNTSILVNRKY